MTTPRRTLLGAMALAPILSAPALAARPATISTQGLDIPDLLECGTSCADAEFARLCSEALLARARSAVADKLFDDAADAAKRASPAFPAALTAPCRLRGWDGEVKREWVGKWAPDNRETPPLAFLARREAKARGVIYSPALEADLRGQFDAWSAGCAEARASFLVDELAKASDDAYYASDAALNAVLAHPARSADVLALKLRLHALRFGDEGGEICMIADRFDALAADVLRVIAC